MRGLSRREASSLKERLLTELDLPFFRMADSLYKVHGKTVNVKATSRRSTGRYWFNIQRKGVHSYIWICYNPDERTWEAYYWIPVEAMRTLISHGSYKDRTWERVGRPIPNFEIDTARDLYIGGGKAKASISRFRNLTEPPCLSSGRTH